MKRYTYRNEQIMRHLQHDEAFREVYERFVQSPWRRNHIDEKTKQLLLVALAASPTHLSDEAARTHIAQAFAAGATREEIAEVLHVVSILGVHACSAAIPPMTAHFKTEGALSKTGAYTAEQRARKEQFIETMGYWNVFRDDLLELDVDYFDAYYDFLTLPIRRGILPPKTIEFMYIAIDASTTHLFTKGIELHIQNAIRYGATEQELLEVIQLTSEQGFDTLLHMYPILEEEAKKYNGRG